MFRGNGGARLSLLPPPKAPNSFFFVQTVAREYFELGLMGLLSFSSVVVVVVVIARPLLADLAEVAGEVVVLW